MIRSGCRPEGGAKTALTDEVKALTARLEGVAAPKLMNTAQCAAFLGKSPDILYEWRRDRKAEGCHSVST